MDTVLGLHTLFVLGLHGHCLCWVFMVTVCVESSLTLCWVFMVTVCVGSSWSLCWVFINCLCWIFMDTVCVESPWSLFVLGLHGHCLC